MIDNDMLENVCTEDQVAELMADRKFRGPTPFGTKLRQKVIDGIVLPKLRQPRKPVLVIGITDGQPAGEKVTALEDTIRYAITSTRSLGPGAVAFQFAQVGNDEKGGSTISQRRRMRPQTDNCYCTVATAFLNELDNHPALGSMIDCTSNYENESAEMARANPPVDLTPDLWLVKLVLGAIHPDYDTQDE